MTHRQTWIESLGEKFRGLVSAGLTVEQAAAWAQLAFGPSIQTTVDHAHRWVAAGFDSSSAIAWNRYGLVSPEEAKVWLDAGYTVVQAHFVMAHSDRLPQCFRGVDGGLRLSSDWPRSGIPAEFVCVFLALGIDVHEARAMWAEKPNHEELRAALDVLLALRWSSPWL